MKWIFLIFKLKALCRLHKRHIHERDVWAETITRTRTDTGRDFALERYNMHEQELKKIENLIKTIM